MVDSLISPVQNLCTDVLNFGLFQHNDLFHNAPTEDSTQFKTDDSITPRPSSIDTNVSPWFASSTHRNYNMHRKNDTSRTVHYVLNITCILLYNNDIRVYIPIDLTEPTWQSEKQNVCGFIRRRMAAFTVCIGLITLHGKAKSRKHYCRLKST